MKPTLKPGICHTFRYTIPESKTVPYIYREAVDFQAMPRVFATGYMVALCEWACVDLLKSHLDWPNEQSVGTHVNLSHTAATPPGLTVTVEATLEKVDGRRLSFSIRAHDGIDSISSGTHERFVIDPVKFNEKLAAKVASA
ncbi:MAG: thioesterase family protein [Betaproteobacteria bacterium]|nr:thioesterase family protein [Betaproteobacteria bacterium]